MKNKSGLLVLVPLSNMESDTTCQIEETGELVSVFATFVNFSPLCLFRHRKYIAAVYCWLCFTAKLTTHWVQNIFFVFIPFSVHQPGIYLQITLTKLGRLNLHWNIKMY